MARKTITLLEVFSEAFAEFKWSVEAHGALFVGGCFWGVYWDQCKPNRKLCTSVHFDMKLSIMLHVTLAHK